MQFRAIVEIEYAGHDISNLELVFNVSDEFPDDAAYGFIQTTMRQLGFKPHQFIAFVAAIEE